MGGIGSGGVLGGGSDSSYITGDVWLVSAWPGLQWLPLVPFTIVVMGAVTAIWVSAYAYIVYRKGVEYVPAE